MALMPDEIPPIKINASLQQASPCTDSSDDDVNMVKTLIEDGRNIHAGFLFETVGERLRLQLCREWDATKVNKFYANWEDFGDSLELDRPLLKIIENYFKAELTLTVLTSFVQKPDATLDKIIKSLVDLQRNDILYIIKDDYIFLTEQVLRLRDSLKRDRTNNVIRPSKLPKCKFALMPLELVRPRISSYTIVQGSSNNCTTVKSQPKYSKIVLITHASDGVEFADKIAAELRRERNGMGRIGVLLLNEHSGRLISDADGFIDNCFMQVDKVIPIITEKYLELINSQEQIEDSCFEDRHVRYIYAVMSRFYRAKNCHNLKTLCIIPDEICETIQRNPTFAYKPVLGAWYCSSQLELLIKCIGI